MNDYRCCVCGYPDLSDKCGNCGRYVCLEHIVMSSGMCTHCHDALEYIKVLKEKGIENKCNIIYKASYINNQNYKINKELDDLKYKQHVLHGIRENNNKLLKKQKEKGHED